MLQLNKLKSYWPLLVVLITTLILLRTFAKPGVPMTHDGNNHLARMANFYIALKDGHIPPRWAPNLNYEYGYPVFNYNYYLPYKSALPFFVLGLTLEQSFKIATFLFLFLGGCFFYLWVKRHVHKLAALAGVILYLAAPPQLLQIFVRGNLGETAAWAILPLLFFSLDNLFAAKNKKVKYLWWLILALSILALMLSHNVVFLLGLPLLLAYGLISILAQPKKQSGQKTIWGLTAVFVGLGLGAYFLLPAFLETSYITLPQVALSKQFLGHFPSLQQLIFSPWDYGYSEVGLVDGMSFRLGIVHWFLLILSLGSLIYLLFKKIRLDQKILIWIYFALVFVVSVFLMLNLSSSFWKFFPTLQKIQFPWRLLVLTTLSISVLASLVLDFIGKKWLSILAILVVLILSFNIAKPQSYLHQDDYMYIAFPFTTSVNHENLPIGFDMAHNAEYKEKLADTKKQANFDIKTWKTQLHEYKIISSENTTIIEHTAYFPGWEVWVDDQKAEINNQYPNYPGLISYQIEQGNHQVKTALTENTPARKIGDIISLLSILAVIGVGGWILIKK